MNLLLKNLVLLSDNETIKKTTLPYIDSFSIPTKIKREDILRIYTIRKNIWASQSKMDLVTQITNILYEIEHTNFDEYILCWSIREPDNRGLIIFTDISISHLFGVLSLN